MTYASQLAAIGTDADTTLATRDATITGLTATNAQLVSDVARLGAQVASLLAPHDVPMPTVPPVGMSRIVYAEDFLTDVAEGSFPADGTATPYASLSFYPRGWKDSSGHGTYDPSKTASVSGSDLVLRPHTEGGVIYVGAFSPKIPGPFTYGRIDQLVSIDLPSGFKLADLLWGDSKPGETTAQTWNRAGEIDGPEIEGSVGKVQAFVHHVGATSLQEQRDAPAGFDPRKKNVYTTVWAPGSVAFYINGVLLGWSTNPGSVVVGAYVPASPMHEVFQAETSLIGLTPAASAVGTVRVGWIVASQ